MASTMASTKYLSLVLSSSLYDLSRNLSPPTSTKLPTRLFYPRDLGLRNTTTLNQISRTRLSSICCSDANGDSDRNNVEAKKTGLDWQILKRWDVPWTRISQVAGAILGVLHGLDNTFQPLLDYIFCYDPRKLFNLQKGWLLWAVVGLVGNIIAVGVTLAGMYYLLGKFPQREIDAIDSRLSLYGSSPVGIACDVGLTCVLAPILEEVLFRGYLMVSLAKWVPTPVAVFISAAVFALAHLSPVAFPQLFVIGTVLGFSYAQTQNLLTPVTIHGLWNLIVLLLRLSLGSRV